MVSYDAVGPGLGQGSVGGDDIGRRKGDVFQAGVPNGNDEVAPLFGFPDKRKKPVDLPLEAESTRPNSWCCIGWGLLCRIRTPLPSSSSKEPGAAALPAPAVCRPSYF